MNLHNPRTVSRRAHPTLQRVLARASMAIALAVLVLAADVRAQAGKAGEHWAATWATAVVTRTPGGFGPPPGPPPQGRGPGGAPQGPPPGPGRGPQGPPLNVNNQTLRQIVHTSIGGERVRVVVSNAYGTAPLVVGAAHVALREKDAAIVPKSDRVLTFGGHTSTTVANGAVAVSDAVSLTVPPLADLAIDLFLPGDSTAALFPMTTHNGASQTSYVSTPGDQAGAADMPGATTTGSWFALARVEVLAPEQSGTIAAFGDSITDGAVSTINTNNRWPDQLARRLAAQPGPKMGVINLGISGNRVLADGAGISALARFDRDVLVQTGVTHVIVLEGINDIGVARQNPSPSAADLIAAHRQLIERAHARGLKIYGGTLTPYEGALYYSPEGEAKRQALNEWIRTSKAYDGVIDFDRVVRDPNSPTKLSPRYDPGDHLHMNDTGYRAMGDAIDLSLFKPGRR